MSSKTANLGYGIIRLVRVPNEQQDSESWLRYYPTVGDSINDLMC